MAGIIDWEDSDKDYLDVSVWQHAKNRLPWLLILMVAYVFTGMIVTSFENRLSEVICLVAYMPMLMGTGGNKMCIRDRCGCGWDRRHHSVEIPAF